MSSMHHRGYSGRVEFDAEDRLFAGHIAGVRDIVGFHGAAVNELKRAFIESVDGYLAACEKLGQAPDKPFSGRVMLRLAPEVHARLSTAAQLRGLSVNQWAAQALEQAAQAEGV